MGQNNQSEALAREVGEDLRTVVEWFPRRTVGDQILVEKRIEFAVALRRSKTECQHDCPKSPTALFLKTDLSEPPTFKFRIFVFKPVLPHPCRRLGT
ncbi:hypothetical protein [Arthrobacter rhombi]|uniref:hypothetical protein n=1 Tax=Arthrobacter rhombi TaxID=71253 RepID=UPI003FD5CAC4